jgi:tetratricopeptide (TPR) repeat protein
MNFNNQIELELYFADHFDTILFPVLADIYFDQDDFRRARKVCDIGLKHHENDSAGLFILAQIEKAEGNLKEAEKLLERVLLYTHDHLAAAEMLCEIQTVLGRATNRLLRSWKHVLELDFEHITAQDFIKKVEGKNQKTKTKSKAVKPKPEKNIAPLKGSAQPDSTPLSSIVHDLNEPLKVSSRLATFTLVSVLKNQGLFSQALEVLDALEVKGESLESISLERDTIQTLIERSKKD